MGVNAVEFRLIEGDIMARAMKILPIVLLGAAVGCASLEPRHVDLAAAYLSAQAKALAPTVGEQKHPWVWSSVRAIEFAPEHQAAIVWDESGLYFWLRGRVASLEEAVSISVRPKDDSRVVYMRLSLDALSAPVPESAGPLVTEIRKGGDVRAYLVPADQFQWLGPDAGKDVGIAGGGFWLSWRSLGFAGPPQEGMIIAVRKIVREPPGAIFTLDGAAERTGAG